MPAQVLGTVEEGEREGWGMSVAYLTGEVALIDSSKDGHGDSSWFEVGDITSDCGTCGTVYSRTYATLCMRV